MSHPTHSYFHKIAKTSKETINTTMTVISTITTQFVLFTVTTTDSVDENTISHHPNNPPPLFLSFSAEHCTLYCVVVCGTSNRIEVSCEAS